MADTILPYLGSNYILKQTVLTTQKAIGVDQSANIILTQQMIDEGHIVFYVQDEAQRTKTDISRELTLYRLNPETGIWEKKAGTGIAFGGATVGLTGIGLGDAGVAGDTLRVELNRPQISGGSLAIGTKENPE